MARRKVAKKTRSAPKKRKGGNVLISKILPAATKLMNKNRSLTRPQAISKASAMYRAGKL